MATTILYACQGDVLSPTTHVSIFHFKGQKAHLQKFSDNTHNKITFNIIWLFKANNLKNYLSVQTTVWETKQ